MQLNPAEISELIKSRIEGLGVSADIRNQGTVVSVTDGIVRIHGLSDAMQGEMLEFPAGADGQPTYGLALNLERDSWASTSTSPKATRSSAPAASWKCRSAPS
jgi:F-type H+/Na+-transporting ATPase subunit alpha